MNTNVWISIRQGSNGTGSGIVSYAVAKNTKRKLRIGTLLIAGQPYRVIQSDITRPTLAIVLPTAKTKTFTNANVMLAGTAKDNVGVARVEYSLNSKTNYLAANGTANWAASITLAVGKNTLRVRSVDLAGNISAVITRTYLYKPPAVHAPALAISSSAVVRMPDHRLHFGFQVIPGSNYVLQMSTDLIRWSDVSTNRASETTMTFTPLIDPALRQQFFRLKSQ